MKKQKKNFTSFRRLLAVFCALVIASTFVIPDVQAANDAYPYPALLDYSDLDASFEKLAKAHILPEYREYVLNAIKYHIETKTEPGPGDYDYRVAKNLLNYKNNGTDGNVLFFFDGCSINLDGAVPCYSGFMKDGKRYNESAVCIDVRLNAAGRPEIVFATGNASTIADNLRLKNTNNGNDISITRDGVYGLKAVNHGSSARNTPSGKAVTYAAMNIVLTKDASVRMPDKTDTSRGTYYDVAGGVDVHSRTTGQAELIDERLSSTGCFNIGRGLWDAEYCAFLKAALGISEGVTPGQTVPVFPTNSSYGYKYYSDVGVIVVDHSNYKDALPTIVGDDNPAAPNAKKGAEIAAMITDRSEDWNKAIWARCTQGTKILAPENNAVYAYRDANRTGIKVCWSKVDAAAKYCLDVYDLTNNPAKSGSPDVSKEFSSALTEYTLTGADFSKKIIEGGHSYSVTVSAKGSDGKVIGDPCSITLNVESEPGTVTGQGVVFLLDGSSSISRKDFAAMKTLMKKLVSDGMSSGEIKSAALVVFGKNISVQKAAGSDSAFCEDAKTLMQLIDEATMPGGPTDMADAIMTAGTLLDETNLQNQRIVVFSDGFANSCSTSTAKYGTKGTGTTEANVTYNVAASFAGSGVVFDTYGFRIASSFEKDVFLEQLAAMSGGEYHAVQ